MKTTVLNLKNKKPIWHLIDARGQILGKVAGKAAKVLIGKDKVEQTLNQNWGDNVVIINSEKIAVSGNKMEGKIYNRYTGFPGGLRSEKLKDFMKRNPNKVLEQAIKNMLPNNKLRKQRMANLHVYTGEEHPHQAQFNK